MKKILITFFTVLLAACAPTQKNPGAPQAWIDAPLDGMLLPLAPYEIVAHASDPGGISQIEFSINGTAIGNVSGSGPLFTAQQGWTPAAPGEYVIRARGMNTGGAWSQYAEVRVVVQGQTETATPEAAIQAATETPAAAATPSQPTLVLIKNANCRRGPGQVYEPLTSLLAGQTVPIEAQNEEGTWWLVRIPSGELCWVSGVTGNAGGNTNALPVATGMPGCYILDPNQNPVCTIPCPKKNPNPADVCTP